MEPRLITAYLGLGGNLGDRQAALCEGLRRLDDTPGLRRIAVSGIYETEPWGLTDQHGFVPMQVQLISHDARPVMLHVALITG